MALHCSDFDIPDQPSWHIDLETEPERPGRGDREDQTAGCVGLGSGQSR